MSRGYVGELQMSTIKQASKLPNSVDGDRQKLLGRLAELRDNIEAWSQQADWSTRRVEKSMRDESGSYAAPGLLMQKEFCRILLDPLGGASAADEAAADLYRMPEYDDVARLYFSDGQWRLHFTFPGAKASPEISDATLPPLSRELFTDVLQAMSQHAA